ncbi:hypothetical protein Ddye_014753 [Dipteronia dyeriana]|uniref:Uncharacterized protein n=1 Tax=Dipteronia dyeriana TaxID=168575 RepID=A0AAE0CKV6_9ROSI|nr:hypothetical protein Ddye_014753 [Dipteronia dyeriana]
MDTEDTAFSQRSGEELASRGNTSNSTGRSYKSDIGFSGGAMMHTPRGVQVRTRPFPPNMAYLDEIAQFPTLMPRRKSKNDRWRVLRKGYQSNCRTSSCVELQETHR